MPSNDGGPPDVWVETRRRVDVMFAIYCIAIAVLGMWVSWPEASKVLAVLALLGMVCVIWMIMRCSIPKEGRTYRKEIIRQQHKAMLVIAAITLPWMLGTLAIDWLVLPHPAWFYAGSFAFFFSLMLGTLVRLEHANRRSIESNSIAAKQNERIAH